MVADESESKFVRIRWPIDAGEAAFANNVILQHDPVDETFYLTFYQITPPVLYGEFKEDVGALETIDAKQIARIALTKERFDSLLELMIEHRKKLDDHSNEAAQPDDSEHQRS